MWSTFIVNHPTMSIYSVGLFDFTISLLKYWTNYISTYQVNIIHNLTKKHMNTDVYNEQIDCPNCDGEGCEECGWTGKIEK